MQVALDKSFCQMHTFTCTFKWTYNRHHFAPCKNLYKKYQYITMILNDYKIYFKKAMVLPLYVSKNRTLL